MERVEQRHRRTDGQLREAITISAMTLNVEIFHCYSYIRTLKLFRCVKQ